LHYPDPFGSVNSEIGRAIADMPYVPGRPGTAKATEQQKYEIRRAQELAARLVNPLHSAPCESCLNWTWNGGGCPGVLLGQGAIHRELGFPVPELPACYGRTEVDA
jgi:hypothetical protein